MYININGQLINSNDVKTARRSGTSITIYFKDGIVDGSGWTPTARRLLRLTRSQQL